MFTDLQKTPDKELTWKNTHGGNVFNYMKPQYSDDLYNELRDYIFTNICLCTLKGFCGMSAYRLCAPRGNKFDETCGKTNSGGSGNNSNNNKRQRMAQQQRQEGNGRKEEIGTTRPSMME